MRRTARMGMGIPRDANGALYIYVYRYRYMYIYIRVNVRGTTRTRTSIVCIHRCICI